MSVQDGAAAADVLEVYWMPGCSSCLRMKEFVEKTGVPYVEVNLAAEPDRHARLRELGLGVPSVILGARGVSGMNLVGIAELVGYDFRPPEILVPAELKARYDTVISTAIVLIDQVPVEGLEYKSPDRDRSLRMLGAHIGTIMRRFIDAYDTDEYDNAGAPPEELAATGTKEDLIAWATECRDLLDAWWDKFGFDDPFDRVLHSRGWGYPTMHEAFERAVWHTTQHTRQVEYFLEERLGITPERRLGAEVLGGLPLPDRIQS